MFIEIRITAKDALKHIMLNNHSPLNDKTTEAIYKTIMKAEIDEGFANELDFVCNNAFASCADGYDDLLRLFDDMNEGLHDLLHNHAII